MKRITLLFFIQSALTGFNQARAQNKIDKNSFTGSWLGRLEVSAIALRIVFNLALNEQDSIVATLDSPDQGAKGIKIGPVTLEGRTFQ